MSPWLIIYRGARHRVEHVPSGCTVAEFATRKAARDFVAAVAPLADWHKPRPARDPDILDAVRRAASIQGAA